MRYLRILIVVVCVCVVPVLLVAMIRPLIEYGFCMYERHQYLKIDARERADDMDVSP